MAGKDRHKNPSFHLRIPKELKAWVQKKADEEDVSLNRRLVAMISKMRKAEEQSV